MLVQQTMQTQKIKIDEALLVSSWQRICEGFQLDTKDNEMRELYDQLYAHYASSERAYHNLQHLLECLQLWQQISHDSERHHELGFALWFHDVIYDPRRHDNEEQSATWASGFLRQKRVNEKIVQRVHALIMATQHHRSEGKDQQLIVDIDLSILASGSKRFDEYQQQIRQEYNFVPDDIFRVKRQEVLQSFVQRKHIYLTPYFFDRFEREARANLARALDQLL